MSQATNDQSGSCSSYASARDAWKEIADMLYAQQDAIVPIFDKASAHNRNLTIATAVFKVLATQMDHEFPRAAVLLSHLGRSCSGAAKMAVAVQDYQAAAKNLAAQ